MLTETGVDGHSSRRRINDIVYDMNDLGQRQDVRLYNVRAVNRNVSIGDIDFDQLPCDRSERAWH